MNLTIEYSVTGPLAHKGTRRALEQVIAESVDLDDAAYRIDKINGLATYKGGSHVAVHPADLHGVFSHGSDRLAILTE